MINPTKMKFRYILCLILLIATLSCNDENYIKPDTARFSGKWTEIVPDIGTFGRDDVAEISFYGNKFTIRWNSYSDTPIAPCEPGSFKWVQHATGTFTFDADSIHLNGKYTDAQYKLSAKCYRRGDFKANHAYQFTEIGNFKRLILNPKADLYYRIELKSLK